MSVNIEKLRGRARDADERCMFVALNPEQIIELLERLEAAERERDALTAHVERLREAGAELAHLMDGVREGEYAPDSFTNQPMASALAETPGTSLARLKAEWQAEALGKASEKFSVEFPDSTARISAEQAYDWIWDHGQHLRRQAEESADD